MFTTGHVDDKACLQGMFTGHVYRACLRQGMACLQGMFTGPVLANTGMFTGPVLAHTSMFTGPVLAHTGLFTGPVRWLIPACLQGVWR